MEYENINGKIVFKDLEIGNLLTGETLSWDELRRIIITATRHATGRPIRDRTLEELSAEIQAVIGGKETVESKHDREKNNLEVQIRAYEYAIDNANQESEKWRNLYVEAARALQKYEEKV